MSKIKVGCKVFVSRQNQTSTVARETKTRWILSDERAFNKRWLTLVGEERGSPRPTQIAFASEGAIINRERKRNHGRLASDLRYEVDWVALPLDTLSAIMALVKEDQSP